MMHRAMTVPLRKALFPDDRDLVAAIFRDYAASLGVDLSFQDFEAELASLPGKYAEPNGVILLAQDNDVLVGCVALRPLADGFCEMKRLYVRPDRQGTGLGRRLALAICETAARLGYDKIRLDTLPQMAKAQRLYESLGFRAIAPYVFNPVEGTKFLERDLADLR